MLTKGAREPRCILDTARGFPSVEDRIAAGAPQALPLDERRLPRMEAKSSNQKAQIKATLFQMRRFETDW